MIKRLFVFLFVFFSCSINCYAYKAYKQGDIVTYNNVEYYVLYDSDDSSNIFTLLKAEPLTVAEVEKYGVGHINNYSTYSTGEVYDDNNSGYGRIVYYSSEQCGCVNSACTSSNCKYDYESSDVKYVVDAWAKDNLNEKDLWKDSLGYSYRLITKEEILEYMNYSLYSEHNFSYAAINGKTPSWLYNNNYFYFTMSDINRISKYGIKTTGIYYVGEDGMLSATSGTVVTPCAIRPVILLRKKALENKINSNTDSSTSNNESGKQNTNNISTKSNTTLNKDNVVVSVPDTLIKTSIIFITIGVILIGTCTTIYVSLIKSRGKYEKDN